MRIARKLMLLALAALAAMALTATTASATDPIEITDNGVHCSEVVPVAPDGHEMTGGCHFLAVSIGDIELTGHAFGHEEHSSNCENEFEVRLNETGEGYVQHFEILPGDAGCGVDVRACGEGEAHAGGDGPWHTDAEETGPGVVTGDVEVCLVTTALGRCEGIVPVEITEGPPAEQYFAAVNDRGINCQNTSLLRAEFTGSYTLVNEPNELIHIAHL